MEDPEIARINANGVSTGLKESSTEIHCDVVVENHVARGSFPVSFKKPYNNTIETVESSEAQEQHVYDLQGNEIKGEILSHGVYIVRQGGKTTKIIM